MTVISIYSSSNTTDRNEGRNWQFNGTVGDFITLLSVMDGTTRQKKVNKEIKDLNKIKSARPTRHLKNIPSNNRIHILLQCTWNIFHDRNNRNNLSITLETIYQ